MTIGRHRFSGSRSLALLALLASCGLAQAAVPPAQISYQGELSNNGSPANGLFNMTFRFYDAANAGTLIMSEVKAGANLVQVTNGLFSTTLGTNGSILDAAGGGVYNNYADLLRDFSQVWVEVEVGGNTLSPRQRMVAAPYALNATRAATLDDVDVAAGSLWQVQGVGSTLTIDGSDVRLRLGGSGADRVSVPSNLYMMHEGAADSDQRLSFTNNGVSGGELLLWDDSQDRFEFTDALSVNGPLAVGTIDSNPGEVFSRVGTGTPVSNGMNAIGDVLISDDIEVLSSIIASGNILMRSNAAEGDANIYFREDGSDTGEVIRWDNSTDKFFLSDAVEIAGNLTLSDPDGVSDIQSTGGVTIRIDSDNNEGGASAGTFSVVANAADVFGTPLLRIQSTDEANLELDNGVVTDAFDFAEAFRAAPGHEGLEPGDVVALSTGEGQTEHCEKSDESGEKVLLGVVSTNPAFTAGMSFEAIEQADPALTQQRNAARQRGDEAEAARIEKLMEAKMREIWKPIAMVGRVPTKVDASFGAIKKGDYLTSSPTPGHAMKMTTPGMALGVALEDFDAGTGVISTFVRPVWHGSPNSPSTQAELTELRTENALLKGRLDVIEAALATKLATK